MKKFVLEGDIFDLTDDSDESCQPNISSTIKSDWPRPQYSDGTYFPVNFLEHETVAGYPTDEWPRNDGVDDVLDIVSLIEKGCIRCCIFDVVALQYYGSERLRNVSVTATRRNHDCMLTFLM